MKIIKLVTPGYTTKVSDEDYDFLNQYRWRLLRCGHSPKSVYARTAVKMWDGRQVDILMHHLVLDRMYGYMEDDNLETDHRNRDPLDNRRENLRWVNHSINMLNRDKWVIDNKYRRQKRRKTTRGYKGVGYNRINSNKYKAYIWDSHQGKNIHIGVFGSDIEAAKAYDKKAIELYGDEAVTNFINTNNIALYHN